MCLQSKTLRKKMWFTCGNTQQVIQA